MFPPTRGGAMSAWSAVPADGAFFVPWMGKLLPKRIGTQKTCAMKRGAGETGLLLGQLGSSLSGNAAEHHRVHHGVATQTDAAVNAAGHFTGRQQTLDDGAIGTQHPAPGVDLHTAHGVVRGG